MAAGVDEHDVQLWLMLPMQAQNGEQVVIQKDVTVLQSYEFGNRCVLSAGSMDMFVLYSLMLAGVSGVGKIRRLAASTVHRYAGKASVIMNIL